MLSPAHPASVRVSVFTAPTWAPTGSTLWQARSAARFSGMVTDRPSQLASRPARNPGSSAAVRSSAV